MRQEEIVLRHLKEVGSLSGREAEDLYRIRDLPKRISVLRQEGHKIQRVLKRDLLGQRYARYSLAFEGEGC